MNNIGVSACIKFRNHYAWNQFEEQQTFSYRMTEWKDLKR